MPKRKEKFGSFHKTKNKSLVKLGTSTISSRGASRFILDKGQRRDPSYYYGGVTPYWIEK